MLLHLTLITALLALPIHAIPCCRPFPIPDSSSPCAPHIGVSPPPEAHTNPRPRSDTPTTVVPESIPNVDVFPGFP
ncbi:hypothetical protein M430DRAFT_34301 [Amorphotheca resinae ATCC 22711]|uniref:Uncharacterized protein n=1 Tax=Amorphotheca resinae ATCC 22711 TaxID=857342 RepID=A0A2T3B6Q5_AMORE|nr:hypothetical protein M430DRAFT_34301 [Amorphotheca resinae ATCC 22711]PSS22426.1 hypothetical protein M430DRAFT_34301 [Amorphotheca resinae ATCC 22711]